MRQSRRTSVIAAVAALALLSNGAEAFYLPGVNPQSFSQGDE